MSLHCDVVSPMTKTGNPSCHLRTDFSHFTHPSTLEGKCPLATQFGLFFMESPKLYFKIYSIVTLLIYENCYSDCTS